MSFYYTPVFPPLHGLFLWVPSTSPYRKKNSTKNRHRLRLTHISKTKGAERLFCVADGRRSEIQTQPHTPHHETKRQQGDQDALLSKRQAHKRSIGTSSWDVLDTPGSSTPGKSQSWQQSTNGAYWRQYCRRVENHEEQTLPWWTWYTPPFHFQSSQTKI